MTRFRIVNWWIARKLDITHGCLAAAGIVTSLVGAIAGYPDLYRGGVIYLLFLAVVVLIHENLHRFWNYLDSHQDLNRMPVRQMKQVNGFLLFCFLLVFLFLFLAVLFVAGFFPWDELGDFLYAGIRRFFHWLAGLIPEGMTEYRIDEEPGDWGLAGLGELAQEEGGNPFWEMLSRAFAVVTGIGFGGFLLWVVVKRLAEYLGGIRFEGDEKVFLKPDETAGRSSTGKRRSILPFRFSFRSGNSTERVRRLYQSCIREVLGKEGRGREKEFFCMTPEQIEQSVGIEEQELHHLYEKARYSKEGCSAEEAEIMQKRCRDVGRPEAEARRERK